MTIKKILDSNINLSIKDKIENLNSTKAVKSVIIGRSKDLMLGMITGIKSTIESKINEINILEDKYISCLLNNEEFEAADYFDMIIDTKTEINRLKRKLGQYCSIFNESFPDLNVYEN